MQNRHHLELTWLEDCIALAQSLNFSRAAASRYVTQPAFSRRIVSLEEWLGTPIFERNRRGVSLTRAGEVFVRQVPELIRALYTLRSESIEAAGEARPDVIFSATHALSFSFFPALMRNNEKIARFGSFRLLSDSLSACERMIEKGDAQFLLSYYHPHMHIHLDQSKYLSVRLGQEVLQPYSRCDPTTREPLFHASGVRSFLSSPILLNPAWAASCLIPHRLTEPDVEWISPSLPILLPPYSPWSKPETASHGCRKHWQRRMLMLARLPLQLIRRAHSGYP